MNSNIELPPITSKAFGDVSFSSRAIGEFFVSAFKGDGAIRLTVARKNMVGGITWDELMDIKDKSGYGDKDAIELFPANDAVMNTANMRHLFVLDERHPFVMRAK